jgi:hypothetical protein
MSGQLASSESGKLSDPVENNTEEENRSQEM